jgi:hypothetical protein
MLSNLHSEEMENIELLVRHISSQSQYRGKFQAFEQEKIFEILRETNAELR